MWNLKGTNTKIKVHRGKTEVFVFILSFLLLVSFEIFNTLYFK